jgi:hypothetical protein
MDFFFLLPIPGHVDSAAALPLNKEEIERKKRPTPLQ